jgi:hypothetical protein
VRIWGRVLILGLCFWQTVKNEFFSTAILFFPQLCLGLRVCFLLPLHATRTRFSLGVVAASCCAGGFSVLPAWLVRASDLWQILFFRSCFTPKIRPGHLRFCICFCMPQHLSSLVISLPASAPFAFPRKSARQ